MSLCFASSGRRRRISPLAGSAVLRDSPLVWFSSILQEISKCLFRSPNRIVVDVPRPRSECSGSVFLRWADSSGPESTGLYIFVSKVPINRKFRG